MARQSEFRILAGFDGSGHARAALAAVLQGPWPDRARVRAVAARQTRGPLRRTSLLTALDRRAEDAAGRATRRLAHRWSDADAVVVDKPAVEGILSEAKKFGADVIVVGWRGYAGARALLMGSVSRGVVRGAKCAVLVVRRRPRARIRKIVIAFDGSPNAERALELAARLSPGNNGRVTLVQVVELVAPASRGPAMAGIRASINQELKRINAQRSKAAENALKHAAALERHGWRTDIKVRTGEPLREIMEAVSASRADLLAVGARGTSGVRHLLLGSVAEGVLSRSPVPVLIAR